MPPLLYTPKAIQNRRKVIVAIFVLLAVIYMLASPIWEVSDEIAHYPVVDYIADTGQLPYQDPAIENKWRQEGSQPPLYYILVALLVSPIDRDEPKQFYNPHAKIGIGLAKDNQNMIVHDVESFPWEGAVLAVMMGRLFSILLGAGTVWLTFSVARLVTTPQVALIAMVLTAFNPMFLFITASINNDNLIIFLATLILVVILSLWHSGWHWNLIIFLAILLGLAALTKLSGLTFVPIAGLVVLLVHQREKRLFRDLLLAGVIFTVSIGAIAGWWYLRNLDLYGDITGLNRMVDIAGHRPNGFDLADLWKEREGFYYAYWGWFGGLNVISPQSFYNWTVIICIVGIMGIILFARESLNVPVAILVLQLIIIFIGVIRWSLQTPASQGRLLFPAIAAISTLLALGIATWRWKPVLLTPLGMYAILLPFIVIRPAYSPPPTVERLPNEVNQVDVRYRDIALLGYKIDGTPVEIGEEQQGEATITLYWQPMAHTQIPLSFFIQVFGPTLDGEPILVGKLDSYPGRGLRRTDQWEIGKIYEETYHILLTNAEKIAPFEPRFRIGWRDTIANVEIPATTHDGNPIDAVIARGGSVWSECQLSSGTVDVRWGHFAKLRDYDHDTISIQPGQAFDLRLDWEAIGETTVSFTVFVQLIDPNEPSVLWGTGDSLPRQQWYGTHAWAKGACFEDHYTMKVASGIPPGTYRILVGLYEPQGGARLPVSVKQGNSSPYPDAYLLDFDVLVTTGEN